MLAKSCESLTLTIEMHVKEGFVHVVFIVKTPLSRTLFSFLNMPNMYSFCKNSSGPEIGLL